MSLRQDISENIVAVLKEIEEPRISLVTREPFNVLEIAITQFPAILITPTVEERETITMGAPGAGRRLGTINYELRVYARGTDLDQQRSTLLEAIEEALDSDRYRDKLTSQVIDSQIRRIEIIERMPPLAEMLIEFQVRYNYLRTQT